MIETTGAAGSRCGPARTGGVGRVRRRMGRGVPTGGPGSTGPGGADRAPLSGKDTDMSRSSLLLAATAVVAGAIGCAHCDTCDDFPGPCTGPNCGYSGPPPGPGPGFGPGPGTPFPVGQPVPVESVGPAGQIV